MLINEREYNKFLENISIYKFILIHGQDRGKVNEKCLEIVNKFNRLNQDSLETISFDADEFYKSENYFYDLVYQKSFFSKLTLIRINLDLLKTEKDILELLEKLDINKANHIIIESKYLSKNSLITSLFKKNNTYALITCYQETNVKQSIIKYLKLYSISLDDYSLNYLSEKFGNDTLVTKNEIKKLALYSNGKDVNFTTVLEAVGDNSLITLHELTDSIGIEKKVKVNYLYEKALNLGLNYIVFLRSISRHLRIILEAKSNNIHNAKNIRPLIHFSRHLKINKQIKDISIKQLKKYLVQIYELEIACKNNYAIQQLLIKKFVIGMSSY
ncbi:MAG: DNA polymerase III subunit delta [Alphaproteobacteria bacterium TMED194]|nr:MAG: DNA polymerase III subunit delta [Alphaproteobacteria bacterium TMED194]